MVIPFPLQVNDCLPSAVFRPNETGRGVLGGVLRKRRTCVHGVTLCPWSITKLPPGVWRDVRFPLYYELKIAFVIWLLSPYTKGASLIYRKFLHPLLSSKEREIDDYIVQAKERGYETVVNFGRQGLAFAATAAVTAAVKSQGAITERLRSFSMHDLTAIQGDEPVGQRSYQSLQEAKKKSKSVSGESAGYGIPLKDGDEKTDEEAEGPYSDDEMLTHKGLRRSQSMKSVKTVKGRKEVRYGSLKYKVKKRPQVYF
uniref:Receptor expression-enhancing protein n=1 Tax=Felis catus TaxID=9685 RepID=A0ABI7YII8_FELCA